jgi:hypothetical protein
MRHYVVFVHGIGEQKKGSYADFGQRLRSAFEKKLQKSRKPIPAGETLVWEEAYWADVTQPDEQKMMSRIGMGSKLRRFFIESLGDVVAYSRLPYPPDKYDEIQKRFSETILRLSRKAQQESGTHISLTVIGHSLGSVIASDGIYNLTKIEGLPANVTIDRFFSMGSPIAVFGLRYGLENFVKPIRPKIWINFFYPQDLIAYRLKTLNSAYETAVSEDISLPPGGANFFSSASRRLETLLPLVGMVSHSWYFTDKKVINKIAEILASE